MNPWIAAALLYAALAVVCVTFYRSNRHDCRRARRNVVGMAIAGLIVINAGAVLVTQDTQAPGISKADVTRTTFGLEGGKAYPAIPFSADMSEAHFSLYGFSSDKDGRVLNAEFVNRGVAYPIAIPANKLVVTQDRAVPYKMAVMIDHDTVGKYGKQRLAAPSPCHTRFEGVVTCQRNPRYVTAPRPDLLLGDVLKGGIERVTLHISPYVYNQLVYGQQNGS